MREVEAICGELEEWRAALSAPSLEEFARVSAGKVEIPREALLLGALLMVHYYLAEALVILEDYEHRHPDRIWQVLVREVQERGQGPRDMSNLEGMKF